MYEHNPELQSKLVVLGLSEQEAIDCLRACNNDVVKAADFYFSRGLLDEWRQANTWDEGVFHRDGYDNSMPSLEPFPGWAQDVNNPPRTSSAAEFSHLSIPMMRYLDMQDSSRAGTPSSADGEARQHLVGGGLGDDNVYGDESERATAYSSSHSNVDYTVQGPDVLTPDVLGGPPRTRPSSPMNPNLDADTNRSDPDFARAIQMSLQDNNTGWGDQETGITGTHTTPTAPYFGPATRSSYDPTDWALTTTAPVTHEIYLDPAHPSDRQRKEGEPAFFKPSSDGYHLGPALAIFHSIPAARNALLVPGCVLDDYGCNEGWWSGQPIEASRITNVVENDGSEEVKPEPTEVIVEVQRLMAFLDRTKRGYGCVDSLAKMRTVYEELQGAQLATFFKSWSGDYKSLFGVARNHEPKPFTSYAAQYGADNRENSWDEFQVLQAEISNEIASTPGATIYNALDPVVWSEGDEAPGNVYLDYVADVFCITMKRGTSEARGIGLDIPIDLYLDRYTREFGPLVGEMKNQRVKVNEEIGNLERRENKLRNWGENGQMVDLSTVETTNLLEAVIKHFQYLRKPSDDEGAEDGSGDVNMETQDDRLEEFPDVSNQLKGVLERLKIRLEEVAQAKGKARDKLKELTTAFTSPETTPETAPPLRKHTLRGLFVDLSTTFIKLPSGLPTPEGDELEEWWCLSYPLQWESDGNAAAYKVMKVSEKEVLDAAKYTGDGNILLVYATAKAMKPTKNDGKLPEPLLNFVEKDNAVFMQELETAGDKGKRKRSTWWTNQNASSSTAVPRILIEDAESMDCDGNGGVHQPPTSPTDPEDPSSSHAAGGEGAPQKKSSGQDPRKSTADEEEQGGHLPPLGAFNEWDVSNDGGEAMVGRAWERLGKRKDNSSEEEPTDRRYNGDFVARMSPFREGGSNDGGRSTRAEDPEEMGFMRIGNDETQEWESNQKPVGREWIMGGEWARGVARPVPEDEEMKDDNHVEHVEFVEQRHSGQRSQSPEELRLRGWTPGE